MRISNNWRSRATDQLAMANSGADRQQYHAVLHHDRIAELRTRIQLHDLRSIGQPATTAGTNDPGSGDAEYRSTGETEVSAGRSAHNHLVHADKHQPQWRRHNRHDPGDVGRNRHDHGDRDRLGGSHAQRVNPSRSRSGPTRDRPVRTSALGTMSISNLLPVRSRQTVPGNTPTTVQLAGTSGYPDTTTPSTLTYSLVSQPAHGTITNFNSSTGTLTYTPDKDYHRIGYVPVPGEFNRSRGRSPQSPRAIPRR